MFLWEPISRYSFRPSIAARLRTRFQIYVPTPNSLILRMSIATRIFPQYNRWVLRRILIYLVLALTATAAARADSSTILVFPFENLSNDRTLDWIGDGISELIIQRLRSEPGAYVFSRDDRVAIYDRVGIPETANISRATALKLGWDTGADNTIT